MTLWLVPTFFRAGRIRQLNNFPPFVGPPQFEGVDAAVMELAVEDQLVLHPHGRQSIVDLDYRIPNGLLGLAGLDPADETDESVDRC
jgi:hypothetical protein